MIFILSIKLFREIIDLRFPHEINLFFRQLILARDQRNLIVENSFVVCYAIV